jgi:hypothetical protein
MVVALLETVLAVLMPNFVHRVFSSYVAAIAFSMVLYSLRVPYLFSGVVMFGVAWIWLHEFRFPRFMRLLQAIGYGLALALIQLKGSVLFGYPGIRWHALRGKPVEYWVQPWMGELLAGVVTLYVVWTLLQRQGHRITDRVSLVALLVAILVILASLEAQGITVGIVILLLGFAGANRILMGFGIASLLFYISSYYYLLEKTLLVKSQTLLLIGLVLLLARWMVLRFMPAKEEGQHAR